MEVKEFKPKTFWERPEGFTGMLFATIFLLGGGYLFLEYLPVLTKLAEMSNIAGIEWFLRS